MNDLERQEEILTENQVDVMLFIARNYNFNALVAGNHVNNSEYLEWRFDAYDSYLRKAVTVAARYYLPEQFLIIYKEWNKKVCDKPAQYERTSAGIDELHNIVFR